MAEKIMTRSFVLTALVVVVAMAALAIMSQRLVKQPVPNMPGNLNTQTSRVAKPSVTEGRHLAFIRSLESDAGTYVVDADLATWLTGAEGAAAARADGMECDSDDCLPNGFYIQNTDKVFEAYPLAPRAAITVLGEFKAGMDAMPEVSLTPDQFAQRVTAAGQQNAGMVYWIEVEEGSIVKISQQYVP